MTPKRVIVDAFGQTDVGLVRSNNEDNFLIADLSHDITTNLTDGLNCAMGEKGTLFLVADGMGGAEAGEVASHMALGVIAEVFYDQLTKKRFVNAPSVVKILRQSIHDANRVVFGEAQKNGKLRGMGTTLTAAAVHGSCIYFAQLGDSRAYLIRNGYITQMTKDQSLVAQLVAAGSLRPEEAKTHPQRNVILQALGVQSHIDVALSLAHLRKGDQLVLCSDGLWGKVEPEEINEILAKGSEPQAVCQQLVQLARERGGEDNITVIIARFDGDGLPLADPDEIPVYDKFTEKTRRRFWPWGRS